MENIYLPIDNFDNYGCYFLLNKNTIRVYKNLPIIGNNNYTDYYINSHYLSKDGMEVIESPNSIPSCLPKSYFTNKIEYRFDFLNILCIAVILFIITVIIPYLIFRRLFGRWLKV